MSALSYFLEREGIMTTGISLVRENTQSMQPPRALWVSFPLGRPLGIPGDAGFQHEVIAAALDLLTRPAGPVLEDFPRDVPPLVSDSAAACPVAFPKKASDSHATWRDRLVQEHETLVPWYALSMRRKDGRTLVGVAQQSPLENLTRLASYLDEGRMPTDISWLKYAVEDLKVFTIEAMTAQPGDYDTTALWTQFWQETALGAAILALYDQYQHADDDRLKLVARVLAPREAVGAATGPKGGFP